MAFFVTVSRKTTLFLLFTAWVIGGLYGQTLRAGLPRIPTVIYRNAKGEPSGFYVDLVEELSRDEPWDIEWVDGSWQECYAALLAGELDLLPIAGMTEEREEVLDFLNTPVITTWSELFIRSSSQISSPLDIGGHRIGLVNGDNNSRSFTLFIQGFGVQYEPVVYDNHDEALEGLLNNEVFAFPGPSDMDDGFRFGVKSSGLHFNPINSTIVFRKGFSSDIRRIMDRKLRSLKNDPQSAYFTLLGRYGMDMGTPQSLAPWLLPLMAILIGIVLITLIFSFILSRRLKKQAQVIRENERRIHHDDKLSSLGHMAGGVAHDFNNMLTGIMGFAEILSEEVTREDHREYCRQILETGERASEITGKLLNFAKKSSDPSKEWDINVMVTNVEALLLHSLDPSIRIIKQLESRSPCVSCHYSQLQNALLNLGINASHAMPEGGTLVLGTADRIITRENREELVPLMVGMGEKISLGSYWEVYVKDNGTGIDGELREKIFEPYYTTKDKGTGLGLSAVLGTVSLHKGLLILESEPGKGTCFRILIPRREETP